MNSVRITVSLSGSEIQTQFKCELTNDLAEIKLIFGDIRNFLRTIP